MFFMEQEQTSLNFIFMHDNMPNSYTNTWTDTNADADAIPASTGRITFEDDCRLEAADSTGVFQYQNPMVKVAPSLKVCTNIVDQHILE